MGSGPSALLKAGLEERLMSAGHHTHVRFVEPPPAISPTDVGAAFEIAAAVAVAARDALAGGAFPFLLSGNCGPAALGPSPAVFWFDAHADFNTPETTVSGLLDGMSLATLTGRCCRDLAASIS